MAVYFLLAPHSMCVKIGYTDGNIDLYRSWKLTDLGIPAGVVQ